MYKFRQKWALDSHKRASVYVCIGNLNAKSATQQHRAIRALSARLIDRKTSCSNNSYIFSQSAISVSLNTLLRVSPWNLNDAEFVGSDREPLEATMNDHMRTMGSHGKWTSYNQFTRGEKALSYSPIIVSIHVEMTGGIHRYIDVNDWTNKWIPFVSECLDVI